MNKFFEFDSIEITDITKLEDLREKAKNLNNGKDLTVFVDGIGIYRNKCQMCKWKYEPIWNWYQRLIART